MTISKHLIGYKSQVTNHKSQVTNHTSQVTPHKSHLTSHKSHIPSHKSHLTNHKTKKAYERMFAGLLYGLYNFVISASWSDAYQRGCRFRV